MVLRRTSLTKLPFFTSGLGGRLLVLTVPCLILAAYIVGGESWLLLTGLFLPLPFLLRRPAQESSETRNDKDGLTGFLVGGAFEDAADKLTRTSLEQGMLTAVITLEFDRFSLIRNRYGDSAAEDVLKATARRISAALRSNDIIARIGDARFAICLEPVRQLDLEICLQLTRRLQTALEEPVSLQTVSVCPTCSFGFCMSSRLPNATGQALAEAAGIALTEAQRCGASSVRAYQNRYRRRAITRRQNDLEANRSLDKGQIHAWFQPQLSTDTGQVSGFEALARWEHPGRGIVQPLDFLPALQQSGQLERLANRMLFQALSALKEWRRAGWDVPSIGVNFAAEDLQNPNLVDKVRWELDRFALNPHELVIEVLETVIAGAPDDVVVRNVNGLAGLGCRIDLDDFGTGHSSISSIRRLQASRLKIDRSFVTRVDQDIEQQRMIAAIVTMAERLGLETLAEGVETGAEQAILGQLGCNHVQGYGIGRPMPFAETLAWLQEHSKTLSVTPKIRRGSM